MKIAVFSIANLQAPTTPNNFGGQDNSAAVEEENNDIVKYYGRKNYPTNEEATANTVVNE
jgi:hypothetical protein